MDAARLQSVGFVTGKRPSVFWGDNLGGDNDEFLEALDPDYFEFVARDCAARLDDTSTLSRADRARVATVLRVTYGQAVEMLMALLCAAAQAPWFPMGWMARYQPAELCNVVQWIDRTEAFHTVLAEQPVSWWSISAFVHQFVFTDDEVRKKDLTEKFAGLWKHVAAVFLSEDDRREYNALKHGLRVRPGGFKVAVGNEKTPGTLAAPEDTQLLGGSEFGSSFVVPTAIGHQADGQLYFSRVFRNWKHESFIVQLQLMAWSINNVISRLRVCGGVHPSAVRFRWPSAASEDPFVLYRKLLCGPTVVPLSDPVLASDIAVVNPKDVLAVYDKPSQRLRGRGQCVDSKRAGSREVVAGHDPLAGSTRRSRLKPVARHKGKSRA
jgi:hypothetical protein